MKLFGPLLGQTGFSIALVQDDPPGPTSLAPAWTRQTILGKCRIERAMNKAPHKCGPRCAGTASPYGSLSEEGDRKMPSTEAYTGRLVLHCVWSNNPYLLNSAADEWEARCLAPESREVGVMERGVRRAGMRGAVMGATGRSAIPLLASGMFPGPPMVGAAGMDPYGLVLMPADPGPSLAIPL